MTQTETIEWIDVNDQPHPHAGDSNRSFLILMPSLYGVSEAKWQSNSRGRPPEWTGIGTDRCDDAITFESSMVTHWAEMPKGPPSPAEGKA